MSEYQRNWYRKNRERLLSQNRSYREQNKEKISAKKKEYYAENTEKLKTRSNNSYRNNPDTKRNYYLINRYGITLQEYDEMFISQNGCCAICGIHQNDIKKSLAVDHNHLTGKIRKLLCDDCNKALGLIRENISTLESMIYYLQYHTEEQNGIN